MAIALGSFVDGLFEGAKTTAALIDTKRKMDDAQAVRDAAEEARQQANRDVANQREIPLGGWGGGGEIDPTATTGTSTPPAAAVPTEIKEGVTGTRDPNARNKGAPELWDQIHPLITKHESGDRANIGYGGTDLTNAPAKPGFNGFPDWAGNVDPQTGRRSHAAGLFQMQPDTWKTYAEPLGVTDFSSASQYKVAQAAYLAEGLRPWAPYNPALRADLAAKGLFGGAATSAARANAPAAVPSALAGEPAPTTAGGTAPPDLETQRAKVQPGPTSNTASAIFNTILKGGETQRQQANVPEGYTTTQPPQLLTTPPAPARPATTVSALDPVAAAAATSAMGSSASSPAASAPAAAVVVTPPSPRPVLSQLRQMQSDQAAGRSSPFPPDQRFNSRGEAVASNLAPVAPGVNQAFARANKVIRLPDGTMVDGAGNVVRAAPSALYPG